MTSKKPIGAGLLLVVAALAAMALAASASATTVTPAATAYKAVLSTNSESPARTAAEFLPTNAFQTTSIQCLKSETGGTTPTSVAGSLFNTNKTATGTFSTGPGGVYDAITTPSFAECGVYARSGSTWVKVKEAVTETTGGWSIQWDALTSSAIATTIGVPTAGAKVFIPSKAAPTCTLTVSPSGATAASGRWTNGESSSTLKVDSQLPFSESGTECLGATSPAQFEATYKVTPAIKVAE